MLTEFCLNITEKEEGIGGGEIRRWHDGWCRSLKVFGDVFGWFMWCCSLSAAAICLCLDSRPSVGLPLFSIHFQSWVPILYFL